ncbi:inositol monophosphatase, partial [Bacillus spizizenii]|nr:inositol monophosphatase [Bacillus spizizenii]
FTFLENHSVLAGNPSIHKTIFEEYLHAQK